MSKILEYDVLTISELAEELDISKKYAYQFLRENNLKYVRIGKKLYIL
ncbi:MAG: helix-turn-helix domain-containing protein [Clostridiales bacterium]|nr:helix-turn-helix domain-containing protein [Clostridiales bacterium]